MKLRALLRALRVRGWTIALITLAALAVSLVYTLQQAPLYASTTRLFVAVGDADAKPDDTSSQISSKQRTESYAALLEGDTIARRVIKQLNLNDSPAKLAERVSTSVEGDTSIIRLTVAEPSANRAQQVANAVAEEFIVFLGELETAGDAPGVTTPVTARIIDAADRPAKPSTPNLPLNLGVGLGVGLLLGLLWALLRERADTTVRSASVLEDATGAPLLGAILFDEDAIDEPTIRELDHYDPRVEGYRVVRTSLQFLDPDHQSGGSSKVYVVTSAVPGEGKTTTAINLALILAEGGEKVALVEADLRRPTFSEYLDLDPARGLTTTLIRRTTLAEATQEVGALDVLTSGKRPPNPAELVKSEPMRELVAQLRARYDYVLIDAPPLLPVTDASLLAAVSDGVILVTRHGDTRQDELATAVTRVKSVNSTIVGSVLNMAPASDADGYGYGYGYAPENHDPDAYYQSHRDPVSGEPVSSAPAAREPEAPSPGGPVQEAVAAVASSAAVTESAAEPVAQPATEPVVERALEPVVIPVTVSEPTPEMVPVAEPVVEPVVEPEPVVEAVAVPADEPVVPPAETEPELSTFFQRVQSALNAALENEKPQENEPEPTVEPEPELEVEAEPEPEPEVAAEGVDLEAAVEPIVEDDPVVEPEVESPVADDPVVEEAEPVAEPVVERALLDFLADESESEAETEAEDAAAEPEAQPVESEPEPEPKPVPAPAPRVPQPVLTAQEILAEEEALAAEAEPVVEPPQVDQPDA